MCGESVNLRQTNCNRCICLHFTYVWVRECLYLIDPRCELEMIDVECNYLTGRLYSLCVFACCMIGLELERAVARNNVSQMFAAAYFLFIIFVNHFSLPPSLLYGG